MFMQSGANLTRAKSGRISFIDVLSAVPPFPSHAREAKSMETRDHSQSTKTNAPINVKPQRGGVEYRWGGSSIGGAFDFLSKFSIKCPTVGQ
jgi:hypothetical protein